MEDELGTFEGTKAGKRPSDTITNRTPILSETISVHATTIHGLSKPEDLSQNLPLHIAKTSKAIDPPSDTDEFVPSTEAPAFNELTLHAQRFLPSKTLHQPRSQKRKAMTLSWASP